jgi:hypothetical protein
MNYNKHYAKLADGYLDIYNKFLLPQIKIEDDNLGCTDYDHRSIAAFRLLFHAEVEEFIEEAASTSLSNISRMVENKERIKKDKLLKISLIVDFNNAQPKLLEIDKLTNEKKVYISSYNQGLIESINYIISKAKKIIDRNNGIKERSLVQMLMIAGIDTDRVSAVDLQLFNEYGSIRGAVAHKSVSGAAVFEAPSSENNKAKTLLTSIRSIYGVKK